MSHTKKIPKECLRKNSLFKDYQKLKELMVSSIPLVIFEHVTILDSKRNNQTAIKKTK